MTLVRSCLTVLLLLAGLSAHGTLLGQDAGDFGRDEKKAVLDALAQAIRGMYLYPDRAADVEAEMRKRFEAGAYDDIGTRGALARRWTDDLREITGDLHFSVRYESGGGGPLGVPTGPNVRVRTAAAPASADVGEDAAEPRQEIRIGSSSPPLDPGSPIFQALHERFRKSNFSMPKLEVLAGNVGYFRLDMMPPLDVAKPTLDAAMTFLSNTDALIIDLRDTPGGVGGFIPYLMSYFFPEGGKLLFTRHFGAAGRTDEYFTQDEVGGERRPNLPIYILTSSSTGSAAENLAFTLKHHGRATLVGETTIGGGHSAGMTPIGDGFTATIPMAEVIHPVTGGGFDGVGVSPHHSVPASQALREAHVLALTQLLESASTSEDRRALEDAISEVRASAEQGSFDIQKLEAFVGQFGERSIFIEGKSLKYRRTGGPALELKPLGDDRFRMAAPAGVRAWLPDVRFDRNEQGEVTGFTLLRDGEVEEVVKKDGR
ncbi:MAG: S41 family peptidase [Planctomycetota bacterium]